MNRAVQQLSKLLPWLACGICVFVLLYGASYLALIWLPPPEWVDMRSRLAADYRPWDFLVFQPVEHAVIEDIRQERELPDQLIMDGSFWPAPTSSSPANVEMQPQDRTTAEGYSTTPTPQPATSVPRSSPTASRPPYTATPPATNTTSLQQPTSTPRPADTLEPADSPKRTKSPKRTHPLNHTPPPKRTATEDE